MKQNLVTRCVIYELKIWEGLLEWYSAGKVGFMRSALAHVEKSHLVRTL